MSVSHRVTVQPYAGTGPEAVQGEEGTARRPRGHRRKARKRRGKALMGGTAMLLAATAGWFTVGPGSGSSPQVTAAGSADKPDPDAASLKAGTTQAGTLRSEPAAANRSDRADGTYASIPGLGPAFSAKIPQQTRQLVVASGKDRNASDTTVTLWTRTPDNRWKPGTAWQGHNAYKGWTTDKHTDDLHSPIGVFSLTDAGGRKADPGSKLPYDQDSHFVVGGTGFNGEQLAGSFDYVVAINYNRVTGVSPLDGRFPDGKSKGGGIWLHVDHGGPTHGCVSLPEDQMIELLKTLDPAAHPMIAMADAATLAT
ncbi:L,D-transpeptidase family protein [Kitasatospora sp. GP82]|uniref:L,D-transpeptidase family protein n=1 Tax=Kitasatospora sp. GP82 TaxID=3035089 RepID=UPI002473B05F|nr:L,D-transpeptidase family protein [Kitasatospora sp. GP82]MDH6124375.1 L,D-peptidoglycan transpeptidase YkuD (ErfK/YbiS/YcfS/YnhG family) [Kitasatospora sp. GP82]